MSDDDQNTEKKGISFLTLGDKLEDFQYSCTPGEKLKHGARIFGTLLANTAIAAGKVGAEIAQRLPEQLEKQKKR